ncbi:3-hydroxybutyryl-CoA dehydrogenase [Amphritea balenae]|uniref:3-hydroxybutyryl-CoA dehydrogenase n=1 Tax=Amphritea balenae TaxID=452629 RepID=A0A3P1SL95_9GAMM|nr:3-hydroxybutyryl-CoA dehydrogenase [Amphritea balenae]RRC98053.1 3-hydroxybutyryl-CoA dehydrogenase [Amphritea balenae]GGK67156.1 3-hydroxybutyryl-CoA dehydrogenase [Amphritea balenae]
MIIEHVGVVGAGQMGNGIAQICAVAGLKVSLCDQSQEAIDQGLATIRASLERMQAKEKITAEQVTSALGRIETSTSTESLAQVDMAIEAATEVEAIKQAIFKELDRVCQPQAILATNTSSISITRIAAVTGRPGKVIGMHFMNPVPMMKLVEVIRALQTDDEVFDRVTELARQLGKVPVDVKDAPGFVANRVLLPMINEAVFTLYEGLASAEEIDTVMKLGMGHPMGPLALADLIGLDTCLSIMEVLHDGFSDSKYRPCPLLKQMVDAGYLGRKSGRGFFQYS